MPLRHRPEPLSPRAAARLRTPRTGYVPTAVELGPGPHRGAGSTGSPPRPWTDTGRRPGWPVGGPDDGEEGGPPSGPEHLEEDAPQPGGDAPDADAHDDGDARTGDAVDEALSRWTRADARRGVDQRRRSRRRRDEDDRPGPLGSTPDARGRTLALRRWVQAPAAFVDARWEPGRLALVGLALVVAIAVAVFGLRVAWASGDGTVLAPGGGSRAGPTGVTAGAAPVGAAVPSGGGVPSAPASPGPSGTSSSPAVVVHVVGQVKHPGLQGLPPGSRVADALAAAGGATGTADLTRVNLARVLVDGEQVVVPAPGDPDPPGASVPGGAAASGGSSSGGSTLVSLNTADLAALDTLPGVGPVLAQRILDWRGEHGRFTSVDELGEVSGIGEKVLERLRPLVTL